MSNYPPPPPYGVPVDHINSYMAPHLGGYNPAVPQPSYQQRDQTSYPYSQSQQSSQPAAPHANAYSFHANAHGVTGSAVNHAALAGYGNNTHHMAIPPPPYPPVPIPFGPSPYVPSHSTQPHPISDGASHHNFMPLGPLDTHPDSVQNINGEGSNHFTPPISELEDGEVNDGEGDELARTQGVAKMGSSFSRQSQAAQNARENPTAGAPNYSSLKRLEEASSGPTQEPSVLHLKHIPISSPQPRRPSAQNGIVDHLQSISSESTSNQTQHMEAPQDGARGALQNAGELLGAKLAEAKQALLELHASGFDFTKIANDTGVNTRVLRSIYAEAGFPINAPPMQQQAEASKVAIEDASILGTPVTTTIDEQIATPTTQSKENDNLNGQPPITTTTSEKRIVTSPSSAPKTTKILGVNLQGKAAGAKAGESKIVDRKEYIARMLAAKASVSSKTSTAADSGSNLQATASSMSTIAPATTKPVVQPTAAKIRDTDMEVKRRAQTELARQKMEALKRRKSVQQDPPITKSNISDHQHQQLTAENKQEGLFSTPTIMPQPPPSHQGSYFSPASQKQPFSIPGLFMAPELSEAARLPQQFRSQAVGPAQRTDDRTTSGSGYQYPSSQGANLSGTVPSTTQATTISTIPAGAGTSVLQAVSSTPVLTPSKRQKAADFIDSPATRVKRPLGQQEDTSVIIDISEDESHDVSDDDSFGMEINDRLAGPAKKSSIDLSGIRKQKSMRDLPPLTDLPPRKKPPVMTPPAAQTPGQIKDAKELKMEIETMNRKIAELEQRRQAKRNISRAQTPGTSGHAPISTPPRDPSRSANGSAPASVSAAEPTPGSSELNSTRQSSSAAPEAKVPAMEDQLTVERRLKEIELAKAEAEQSLAADVILTSEENRGSQEEKSEASIQEEQSSQQDAQGDFREEEEHRFQHQESALISNSEQNGFQGDRQVAEENDNHQARRDASRLLLQQKEQKRLEREDQSPLEEQQQGLDEQRRLRRTQIEAGLPVLDETMEKTRQKLESLKKEIADLEKQIQEGVQGRKLLMEELVNLYQATDALRSSETARPLSTEDVETRLAEREGVQVPVISEAPDEVVFGLTSPSKVKTTIVTQEPIASPQKAPQPSPPPQQPANEQLSDGELEEDVMDISRSEADEGEISDHSPEHIAESQDDRGSVKDEDSYEPPSDIIMSSNPGPDTSTIQPHQDDQSADAEMLDAVHDSPVADSIAVETAEEPILTEQNPANADTAHANMQDEEKLSYATPSPADDSDPDDYEPPEPFEEDSTLQPASADRSDASFSPLNIDQSHTGASILSNTPSIPHDPKLEPTTIGADPQEEIIRQSNHPVGHFVPYESPLKQFKSYRYHPAYLNEVSNGFRSLTYSHTIDPEIPICRYEIGGVCNDESCKSQHFRAVGLNDDKILMDLGARPEGLSPQEAEKFTDGLRQIIQDIGNRKVTGFNDVAAEITAYRAKFLGDSSKILPL